MSEEEIHAELKAIHEELAKLVTADAVRTAMCESHFNRTRSLESSLYGNGKDGVKTRLERIEASGTTRAQLVATIIAALASLAAVAGVIVMLMQWAK